MALELTKKIIEFITNISFDGLPKEVISKAKANFLDWLGSAIRASQEAPIKSLMKVLGPFPHKGSTVIGNGTAPAIYSALINGTMGHLLEIDDVHSASVIHPAAPVMPATLSVAEQRSVNGKELILAIVVGYEIEIRLAEAIMPSHYKFWHNTATCGSFGATAAAGKILGLSQDEFENAFGITSTQASGLTTAFGTLSKPLQVGKAAFNGVLAALLAKNGFTGPRNVFDRKGGFIEATSQDYKAEKMTKGLGMVFKITETVYKLHASCAHTHGAIDAVLEMKEEYGIRYDDLEEIVVKTYPSAFELVGKKYEPKSPEEAKFSLPYCVASALIFTRVGLDEFSKEKIQDDEVVRLAKKVKVFLDPTLIDARLGSAEVVLKTKDGIKFSKKVMIPKGHPENPVSDEELRSKFQSTASPIIKKEGARRILKLVDELDRLDDIHLLTSNLRV